MKAILSSIVVLSLFCLTGCSTVVNGRRQSLVINSDPPGAKFDVDGITGVTPGTAKVQRRLADHKVTVQKPGYESSQQIVLREINPWLFGNLLLTYGAVPGALIDFITGAAYELETSQIHSQLKPLYGDSTDLSPPQASTNQSSSRIVATSANNQVPLNDQQTADLIATALGKAGLSSLALEVHYADGQAQISGSVATPEQRALITEVVSNGPGVKSVDNRVIVSKAGMASTGNKLAARGQDGR